MPVLQKQRRTKLQHLTDAQEKVLDFIKSYTDENGWPPTRGEISTEFNWVSSNAAHDHLKAIEKKGYIYIAEGVARGIKVL